MLTKKQIKDLPFGTVVEVLEVGKEWDSDGKWYHSYKIGNKLVDGQQMDFNCKRLSYYDIDEMDEPGYEFLVRLKRKGQIYGFD